MKKEQPTNQLPGALDLFSPSWQAFKVNWLAFILGALIPTLLWVLVLVSVFVSIPSLQHNSASVYGGTSSNSVAPVLAIVGGLLGICAIILAAASLTSFYYYVKVQSVKGIKVRYWPAFRASLHYFWRTLGLVLLRMIMIAVGIVLLIVPGLFIWKRYMLAPYYLVDQDIGIGEAMRRSAADSKEFAGSIWPMMAVYIGISVLGYIPIIGWLFSLVLGIAYICAAAARYYQIQAAK